MRIVREHINEKFVEDSDPIEDMGIGFSGIMKELKNKVRMAGNRKSIESSMIYYEDTKYSDEAYAVYFVLDDVLRDNKNKKFKTFEDIQNSFEEAVKHFVHVVSCNVNLRLVVEAINKFFGLNVHFFKLRESLNEKFELDSDPIHDLGIGEPFVKIKRGNIIKPKDNISEKEFTKAFKRIFNNQKDVGASIRHTMRGVIKKADFYKTNYLKLTVIFFDSIESAKKCIKNKQINKSWTIVHGQANILKWIKYFEIVKDEVS
jgi:hypothetical protein